MTATLLTPTDAGIQVGDFFASSWGYDQTNVDFYKVVALTPKGIKVQKWTKGYLTPGNGNPHDYVVPGENPAQEHVWVTDKETGEVKPVVQDARVMQKTMRSWGDDTRPWITISSYEVAKKWDGEAEYQTGAGWGH